MREPMPSTTSVSAQTSKPSAHVRPRWCSIPISAATRAAISRWAWATAGLKAVTLADVKAHAAAVFTQDRLIIGLAGATSPEQVRANAAAITWVLSDDERAEVDRLTA